MLGWCAVEVMCSCCLTMVLIGPVIMSESGCKRAPVTISNLLPCGLEGTSVRSGFFTTAWKVPFELFHQLAELS